MTEIAIEPKSFIEYERAVQDAGANPTRISPNVTGLIWTLVLVMTWLKTEHELSELLDAHLAQTAAVLAVQTSDEHDDDFTTRNLLSHLLSF